MDQMRETAKKMRRTIIQMSHDSRASHLGSALSCVDILVALYWGVANIDKTNVTLPSRDRIILSKGHAVAALYAALAFRGIIDNSLLNTFCRPGSILEEHPGPESPKGVEAATGSLGHGLSLGAGMALAGKIQGHNYNVYVLGSDGECNEGSVWEAAMMSAGQNLGRLCVIIDYNRWQATGRSREITAIEPFVAKWKSFGWNCTEVDGHDIEALTAALSHTKKPEGKPVALIAHTVKGKGVSFMEDDNNWHYRIPDASELEQALKELEM